MNGRTHFVLLDGCFGYVQRDGLAHAFGTSAAGVGQIVGEGRCVREAAAYRWCVFRNEPLTRRARILRVVLFAVLFWLIVGVLDLVLDQQLPSGGDLIKNAVMAVIATALVSAMW